MSGSGGSVGLDENVAVGPLWTETLGSDETAGALGAGPVERVGQLEALMAVASGGFGAVEVVEIEIFGP